MTEETTRNTNIDEPVREEAASISTALSFNPDDYKHFFDDTDMTSEQKTKYLETIWEVVVALVDLGFGTHPVQQAMNVGKRRSTLAEDAAALISCADAFNKHAKNVVAAPRSAAGKKDS